MSTKSDSDSEEWLPSALDGLEADRAAAAAARHAFNPGDLLKAGRYRPFRKIGDGHFSQVWLARDVRKGRYVSVKIGLTWHLDSHWQIQEISIMNMLAENPILDHPGRQHVAELLDDFIHEGPNGRHVCVLTRPLGRLVEKALTEFIWGVPAPYSFCRQISIQALRALDYVHQKDIMHGDIHPGNFLLDLTYNIDEDTEEDIKKKNTHRNELNDPDDAFTLDDKVDIASGNTSNATVLSVDFGASRSPKDTGGHGCAYTIPYRAPEVVMDIGGVTAKADIWALGCTIWRIVTGSPLFAPEGWGGMDETNVEQIVTFVERLGPVPDSLCTAWLGSENHLMSNGQLKSPFPEDERELPLEEEIEEMRPKGMGEDEVKAFIEFLGLIFRFEPQERSSTEELLQHRWVTTEWELE